MRVIAGSARRLNLVTPKGNTTRPTSDMIKETLFNILMPYLYDIDFLDLFAGSGGIGIEALSRGARSATFIEKDKNAIECIKKNLVTTHFEDKATLVPYDVLSSLYNLKPSRPFGIIFMDPPYDDGLERTVLGILASSELIDDDTMIIVEAKIDTDFSYLEELGLKVSKIKEYKNNKHVFIYKDC